MSDVDRARADAMGRGFAGEPPTNGPFRDAQMVAYLQGQEYRSNQFPPQTIAYPPEHYASMAYEQCARDHPEPNATNYGGEGWSYCRALEDYDFRLRDVLFSTAKMHRAYISSDGKTGDIGFRTDLANSAIAREIEKLQRLPEFLQLPDSPESYAAYLERFREFDDAIRKWCIAAYEKYEVPVPEDWQIPGRSTGLPATAQSQADWRKGVAALRIERAMLFIPKTYLLYNHRSSPEATKDGERAFNEYTERATRVSISIYEELGLTIPAEWLETKTRIGATKVVPIDLPPAAERADLAASILKGTPHQQRSRRKWLLILAVAAGVAMTAIGIKFARGAESAFSPNRSSIDSSSNGMHAPPSVNP